jgi:tetratricopeptide (TPR) repeat protein
MGEVYLADDRIENRQVAVKILSAEAVFGSAAVRFAREIAISAKLSHPGVARVYDSGRSGDVVYYVMEYVEGESLRDSLARETQLSVDTAVRIAVQVANALACAHEHGIIHRDVKPANIIIRANGEAVITDFGIARFIRQRPDESLTSDQTAVGTLAYMSPEQASASGGVDARSDMYSLAVVVYEMLAGEIPFRAATPEAMFARKAIGRYSPLRDIRPSVSPELDSAIARALQPVPADRFESISVFRSALQGAGELEQSFIAKYWRHASGVMAAVILIGAAAYAIRQREVSGRAGPVVQLGRTVVAPFENRTGDPALDAIGVMAGDWITDGLQRTGIVEVVPMTTSLQATSYVRTARPQEGATVEQRLAVETGASTVVSGSLYRQGERLYLRASVADRQGTRLVGGVASVAVPVSSAVAGVEQLRDKLMGWLAMRYDDRLNAYATPDARPPTYDSYQVFSEGMTRYVAVENARALPLFIRAYEVDTSFVQALLYASIAASNVGAFSLADSLLQRVSARRNDLNAYDRDWLDYRIGFVRGDRQLALSSVRNAAARSPTSKASYNHALEAYYSGDLAGALNAIQSITPDRGAMRGFAPYWDFHGTILHSLGRYEDEASVARRARLIHPDRLTVIRALARSYAARAKLDSLGALMQLAERMPVDPTGWDFGHTLAEVGEELRAHGRPLEAGMYFGKLQQWLHANASTSSANRARLARAQYALGSWAGARRTVEELRASDSSNVDLAALEGLIAARQGRHGEARVIFELLPTLRKPYQFGSIELQRARLAAVLGDQRTAMAMLTSAFEAGRPYDLGLHRDMDLGQLGNREDFDRLLRGREPPMR